MLMTNVIFFYFQVKCSLKFHSIPFCSLQLQCFTFRAFTSSHFLSVLQVQRVLKVLEKPFSSQPGLECPTWVGGGESSKRGERDEGEEPQQEAASTSSARDPIPYDSKPPAWANEICVT